MNNKNLVQIDRLTFGYDQRVILSDITMEFPRGKVIATSATVANEKGAAMWRRVQ